MNSKIQEQQMAAQPSKLDLKTLEGRIAAARKAKNLSIQETADRIGISRVQLYSWEKGETTEPGLLALVEFTRLTEVSLDWLVKRDGPDPDLRPPPKPKK